MGANDETAKIVRLLNLRLTGLKCRIVGLMGKMAKIYSISWGSKRWRVHNRNLLSRNRGLKRSNQCFLLSCKDMLKLLKNYGWKLIRAGGVTVGSPRYNDRMGSSTYTT